jgi:predicted transcriptional regulator of viral defense system
MEKDILLTIFKLRSTVFTFTEILMNAPIGTSPVLLKRKLNYYVHKGLLYSIRRGIYARDKHYDKYELATKILIPAYISFETVLLQEGVTFQYYSTIFVATYQTRDIECDGHRISFKKLKGVLLTDPTGIERRDNYFIASKERAFLDILYLNKNYYFDNLDALDFDKVFAILPIYKNKRMERVVQKKFKITQEDNDFEKTLCNCR